MTCLNTDLAEIAEIAGMSAALAILRARRGSKAYIPAPDRLGRAGRWLVEAVGIESARVIAERFAGCSIELTMGGGGSRAQTWAALRKALDAGHDVGAAARLAGVSQRTARRHKNGHVGRGDPRQGDLFD
jgi:hypothetical protein